MSGSGSHLSLVAARTGGEEQGLYSFRADTETGGLSRLSSIPAGAGTKFLALGPDARRCYAVATDDGGTVLTVDVDPDAGSLSELNRVRSGGDGPCYCSVDAAGSHVFVAHYGSGSVAMLPVDDDGRVRDPTDVVEHEGAGAVPERQAAPHPHAAIPGPDDRFVYVPDLGIDRVHVYEIDRDGGALRPAADPYVAVTDGTGPRHIEFGPDGRFAYLVGELDSTLTTLERDAETGALSVVGRTNTLPDSASLENKPADVHVHPSGRWVYVSNRGHDSVAVFEVGDAGSARPVDHVSTRGSWPRDFALGPDGRYLYAENQNDDEIVVFEIDGESGTLTATGEVVSVPHPGCMVFART